MCHNNNGNENNYYGNPRMSGTLPELIDTLGSVKKPTGRPRGSRSSAEGVRMQ